MQVAALRRVITWRIFLGYADAYCSHNAKSSRAVFRTLKPLFIPTMETYDDASAITSSSRGLAAPQQKLPEIFRLEELNGLNMYEVSVTELQKYLTGGQITSVEYVNFCLTRIHKVNPYLECVIEVNPDALAIAAILDDERQQVRSIHA